MQAVLERTPITVPDFPPDHYGRTLPDGATAGVCEATWHVTETTDTIISTRRTPGENPERDTFTTPYTAHERIREAIQFAEFGLEPLMDNCGIRVEMSASEDGNFTYYTMSLPDSRTAAQSANAIQYPAQVGRRARFEIFEGEFYSSEYFFSRLQEGIMPLSMSSDSETTLHDLVDHFLVGLTIPAPMLRAMMNHAADLTAITDTTDPRYVQQDSHQGHMMNKYDYLLFSPNFLSFLNKDQTIVKEWSYTLGVSIDDVKSWATQAQQDLALIASAGISTRFAAAEDGGRHFVPRQVRRVLGVLGIDLSKKT